ncbi:hypothetical protein ABEB36_006069 [Hypothenemus hampei]|uniref:Uncharacterized protein n=1 Tax=Hypothenemus hampei TaxID=57062 RepID=A0ABD1F0F2_HYPHA
MLQTGQGKYLEKFRLRSIRPGHEKCVQPTDVRKHVQCNEQPPRNKEQFILKIKQNMTEHVQLVLVCDVKS